MSELTNIHARAVKDLTTPTELPVYPDALDKVKLVAGNFPAEYTGNEAMTVGMIKDLAAQGREAELEKVFHKITQEETRAKEVESLLIQNKAEKTYVDSELAAQNTKVNNHLSNQTQTVNTALSQLSTVANKFYPTLTAANADIANIAVNQPVQVGEIANGGLWYKATAVATSLTKSPYDPVLSISKNISALTSYQSKDLDADRSFLVTEKLAGHITAQGGVLDADSAIYVLNKNVASQTVKSVVIHSNFIGRETKIKTFKKGADRFTLNREIATLTTTSIGFNYFILPEDILLASDEWLGFSCATGSISYTHTSSPTALYYSNKTSTTATEVMLANEGKTALLQIGFYSKTPFASVDINLKKQVAILQNQIDDLSSATGVVEETIGYATPKSSTVAGVAQWIIANPTKKSGTLREFQTYSSVSGQLDVCIYERTGVSDFSPKYMQTVSVVQGFNIIELDQPVNVGDYLGIRTSAVGMTQYTQSTSGFSIYSHTNLNAVTGFAGPTGGFIWHFNFKIVSTNSHAESNKWEGKTYTSFGDSITWYNGRNFVASHIEVGKFVKGYQSYIVDALGCTLDNKGESGWDMTQIFASRINTYDFSGCYLTTITSGANDCRRGVPVGTLQPIGSAFNTSTYAGALQASIEKIITSNPYTKIVLITPIRGWYAEYNTSNVPNTDPTVVGVLKREYPEMVKAIAQLYGLPVVDFYDELGWNDLNKNIYLGDNPAVFTAYLLHPNNKGYQRMGELLLSKLKDL